MADATVKRSELVQARAAGARAYADGAPVLDCPHSLTGAVDERLLAVAWIRGWTGARNADR